MANFAFIDSQNVHLAVRDQGWSLDWPEFRRYLKDKHGVIRAFVFIGYVEEKKSLYAALQSVGFITIFKPTLKIRKNGKVSIKGNVDAELVLHAMIEYQYYEKAVIVTGDGDFHCLVAYLKQQGKLERLLVPNRKQFSSLLRGFMPSITFMNDLQRHLQKVQTKRPP